MENIELKVLGGLCKEGLASNLNDVLGLGSLRKGEVVLFCDYSEFEIPAGSLFDKIYNKERMLVYKGEIVLKSISQQFGESFDSIPKGWKTICKFSFSEGQVPEVIRSLTLLNGWQITDTYFFISA